MADLIIRGRNVVLPDGIGAHSIHVRDGLIEAVRDYDDVAGRDCELIDADDAVVMPGLVDTRGRSTPVLRSGTCFTT